MRLALLSAAMLLATQAAMAAIPGVQVRETVYTGGDYDKETFRYLFIAPKTIEPGKTYPLVLFLHGAGERGDDVELLEKHFVPVMASDAYREKFPAFVVIPQCRKDQRWATRLALPGEPAMTDGIATDQMKMALQCVDDVIREFPVDKNRLYLTGLSMGGYGSWDLASRQPERWAAVVPICGGGDESKADVLKAVPIWAVHGDADKAVPVEQSRKMIAAIKAAGGKPNYTEYPGVGHDSWTRAYADPNGVLDWMFKQRLDQRSK